MSSLFLVPFFGLTGSPAAGGRVLEVPSLIAMLVYAFLGWGVVRVRQRRTVAVSTPSEHQT